jgi:hypothetical protein
MCSTPAAKGSPCQRDEECASAICNTALGTCE